MVAEDFDLDPPIPLKPSAFLTRAKHADAQYLCPVLRSKTAQIGFEHIVKEVLLLSFQQKKADDKITLYPYHLMVRI